MKPFLSPIAALPALQLEFIRLPKILILRFGEGSSKKGLWKNHELVHRDCSIVYSQSGTGL